MPDVISYILSGIAIGLVAGVALVLRMLRHQPEPEGLPDSPIDIQPERPGAPVSVQVPRLPPETEDILDEHLDPEPEPSAPVPGDLGSALDDFFSDFHVPGTDEED